MTAKTIPIDFYLPDISTMRDMIVHPHTTLIVNSRRA